MANMLLFMAQTYLSFEDLHIALQSLRQYPGVHSLRLDRGSPNHYKSNCPTDRSRASWISPSKGLNYDMIFDNVDLYRHYYFQSSLKLLFFGLSPNFLSHSFTFTHQILLPLIHASQQTTRRSAFNHHNLTSSRHNFTSRLLLHTQSQLKSLFYQKYST